MIKHWILSAVMVAGIGALDHAASAAPVRHRHGPSPVVAEVSHDRPLTIGGRRGRGLIHRGDDIIALGGFSAHGYGYPPATAEDRREALNARIRSSASGPYAYGFDGLGGTGFGGDRETGSSNPFWGNGYNAYVGYNGTPTDLAFGPGFANRHLADHDPFDDDEDEPAPAPADLGYGVAPAP